MADAKTEDFDPNDRIAEFSLLSIKRTLQMVGIMEDRDDIAHVASSLSCPPQQALRVLEELERRGLVARTAKKRQWVTTPRGWQLAIIWHPPRVLRPAIEYEAGPGSINRQCEAVSCSIWRYTSDEEEMLEEAELDVGIHVDYDTDRLIRPPSFLLTREGAWPCLVSSRRSLSRTPFGFWTGQDGRTRRSVRILESATELSATGTKSWVWGSVRRKHPPRRRQPPSPERRSKRRWPVWSARTRSFARSATHCRWTGRS
jgi:hypothetical protein